MSKIQPGSGYGFTSSGYGFSLNAEPPFDATPPPEWTQLKVYENPAGEVPAISVWPGTVNGVVPKIAAAYIDAQPTPKIEITGNGTVYLSVTRVSGDVFPKLVQVNFAATVPADTFNVGNFALASIVKNGNNLTISQFITTSLIVSRVAYGPTDSVFYWFRV